MATKRVAKARAPKIVREKIKKQETKKQFWNLFLMQAGLFVGTSVLSLAGAVQINQLAAQRQMYLPTTTVQDFVFSFLLVTAAVLLLVFFKRGAKVKEPLYKGLFVLAVFAGGMALLQLFLPVFVALIIIGALLIIWFKKPTVLAHDAVILLALGGAAAFLGSELSQANIIFLLLLFAIYDGVAVYATKHLLTMVKEMTDKKVIWGFIIPNNPKHFDEPLSKITVGGSVLVLGGGDVAFPNMLVASLANQSLLKAAVVMIFALAGSLGSLYLFSRQGKRELIPALPAIVLAALLGYLLTLLW